MKALRIVGFLLCGIVVLVAILVGVALMPSVQTWAVRKAVADQPGLKLEVGRVAAGLSSADIADLHVVKDGMVITAKSVTARYSAWDYLSGGRINVDVANVQDLLVDLSKLPPAKGVASPATGTQTTNPPPPTRAPRQAAIATSPVAPFTGVLQQASLPFEVRVASFAAKGRALLPANQTVVFDLKGAGIETGQRGKLEWTIDFADATPNAPLRALRSTGAAHVHIARDNRIDIVEVDTVASAMGPNLPPDRIQVVAKLEQPAANGNETYGANVALLRGSTSETLLKLNAQFLASTREIAGAWDIAIRSEQLAALLAGLGLPEVAAQGGGKFTLKPETTAVASTGDLEVRVTKLEKIAPALAAIGGVTVNVSFDGGLASEVAQLNKLTLQATAADGLKIADIATAQKIGYELKTQRVTFADAKSELARIKVEALPLAWAQSFAQPMIIDSGTLSLALAVEGEPDGSRVRVRAVEPLAIREVTVRQGDKKLADRVTLTVRPSVDYSAARVIGEFADLSVTMPAGDSVTGKVSANVTNLSSKTPIVAFNTQINAKLVSLVKTYAQLPFDTGALSVVSTMDGRLEGDILQLAKATTAVTRDGGALLASFETQQPLRVDLKQTTITPTNPQATTARIRLGEVPLAWAEGYVKGGKFAGSFNGAVLDISLRSVDDVSLASAEPFVLRGVTATLDGKPQITGLDITAHLSANKKGDALTYDLRSLEVKQGATLLTGLSITGTANLGAKLAAAAKGKLEADVPALTKQPALASFATLSSGKVAVDFDGTYADAGPISAKAAVAIKNLVAKADNRALGDLDLKVDAVYNADGSGKLVAPLTLTSASRKSDIAINAAFGNSADGKTKILTGKVSSDNLIIDDFMPLAGAAPASQPAKPAPTTPAPRPTTPSPEPPVASKPGTPPAPTGPFWKGYNGKLELDFKRILYGKDYPITELKGLATVTDSKLSLDGISGKLKGDPFKIVGGVSYAASQPKPYVLGLTANLHELDIGGILLSVNPNEKPGVETRASLAVSLNGTGATVADLRNTYGTFSVTGTQGVLRMLAQKGKVATATNVLSTGLAILGAAKGSSTTVAIGEFISIFNELPFDSVKFNLERGADLKFRLTTMEVLSPTIHLKGSGALETTDPEKIANAPWNVVFQMGTKGSLQHLMGRAGLLGQAIDEKGYNVMSRQFKLGGTPAKTDSSDLWKILGEAALGMLAR